MTEYFKDQIENTERFEHYICTHVFGRIKMYLYDTQGDEDYMLDMPPEVFEKILEILNQYKKGTYKPSNIYQGSLK